MHAHLTADNLMKLNYENDIIDMSYNNINLTNSNEDNQFNKQKRYISITNELNCNQYSPELDMNIDKESVEVNEYKLSTTVKYITTIGAVCAVMVLIGFVMLMERLMEVNQVGCLITPMRRGPSKVWIM